MAGEFADVLEIGGDALLWSLMSGVSACETDLSGLRKVGFLAHRNNRGVEMSQKCRPPNCRPSGSCETFVGRAQAPFHVANHIGDPSSHRWSHAGNLTTASPLPGERPRRVSACYDRFLV